MDPYHFEGLVLSLCTISKEESSFHKFEEKSSEQRASKVLSNSSEAGHHTPNNHTAAKAQIQDCFYRLSAGLTPDKCMVSRSYPKTYWKALASQCTRHRESKEASQTVYHEA